MRHLSVCLLTAFVATTFVACGEKSSAAGGGTGEKLWKSETVEHKNFKDLGNYVIELPDFTDPAALQASLDALNAADDGGLLAKFGCTSMAKKNDKGEVIFGRNTDLDISQKCAYLFKTTFGKYKNFCVAYTPGLLLDYAELQKKDSLEQSEINKIICGCCDAFNEKGLYIQANLREETAKTLCYGLHSSHGEKTRSDGKPWTARPHSSYQPDCNTKLRYRQGGRRVYQEQLRLVQLHT